MFQLREEHMQAFGKIANDNFEDRAVAHVRKQFPKQTSSLNDDDLRARIQRDASRAKQSGFSSERQLMKFVDSSILLGENFFTQPEHEWARTILADPSSADDRAWRLLDGAVKASGKRGVS